MYKSIIDAVLEHGRNRPEKLALADNERAITYKELVQHLTAIAGILRNLDIHKGDNLLVECTQDARFIAIDLACELSHIVFIPIEKKMSEDRVKSIYEHINAKALIAKTDYAEIENCHHIDDIWDKISLAETNAEYDQKTIEYDIAEILFTTGTTGIPKGIVISHRANVAIAENIKYGVEMKENAIELVPLPLSHSHGLRTCYAHLLNGSTTVIIDGIMNVGLFFDMIEKYGVNAIDISPTLAKILLKIGMRGLEKYKDKIDYIEIGSAVLEEETKKMLKKIFMKSRLYNFYGSTEAGRCCVCNFNEINNEGCIGRPSINAEMLIVDDSKKEIHSSKEKLGLLAIRGSMIMNEYYNNRKLTEETLINDIIYTNDLGYIDESGKVYIVGRNDDIINYKGIKIAPEEIESVATLPHYIKDCACVPIKDNICGQVPMLYVSICDSSFDINLYIEYLRENLEQTRVPKRIEVVEQIPRSENGKLLRKRLMTDAK
ncbi:MAG: acyl--CoA ligase [Clostridia bacterium]|nr:acyl--CoA ligase [Clostridia bacterium]